MCIWSCSSTKPKKKSRERDLAKTKYKATSNLIWLWFFVQQSHTFCRSFFDQTFKSNILILKSIQKRYSLNGKADRRWKKSTTQTYLNFDQMKTNSKLYVYALLAVRESESKKIKRIGEYTYICIALALMSCCCCRRFQEGTAQNVQLLFSAFGFFPPQTHFFLCFYFCLFVCLFAVG